VGSRTFLCRALLATLALLAPPGRAETPAAPLLVPGAAAVERQLAGGETHAFRLQGSGRYLLVTVEQQSVNVVLAGTAADGTPLDGVDGSADYAELETMLLPPAAAGAYRVEVRTASPGAPPGRYAIHVEELAAGTPAERRRIEAERSTTEAGRLQHRQTADAARQALARYAAARQLWRALGDVRQEARVLHAMAEIRRAGGEARPALELYGQALDLWTSLGLAARQADALTAMGLASESLGEHSAALAQLERALALRRSLGDRRGEALVQQNVCLVRHSAGDWRAAVGCYEQALALLRAAGDPGGEAAALGNLGGVYDLLGEPLRAQEQYEQALARMRLLGNRKGEAQMRNNLAAVHGGLGEMEEALADYERALAIFREMGDRAWEARVLSNLGTTYRDLGEERRAVPYFAQALDLRRALADRRGEAATLANLGLAWQRLGEDGRALDLLLAAQEAARAAGDRRLEALTLGLLAQAHVEAGDPRRALPLFDQALALQRSLGDRRGEASVLHRAGEARARLGETAAALALFGEALELRRAISDRAGEAETLTALARWERRLGRLDAARSHAEAAIETVESLRTGVVNPDLRASFLGSQQRAYELEIDLLMESERREPGRGHAAAALAVSERARARTLLELLREAGTDVRQSVDPALRQREREVSRRLAAKARRQLELLGGPASEAQRTANERDLRELLAAADQLETEIRRASPRYAALTRPQPLDAAGIRELLDPGTLLLEYSLGEERSFLWALDAAGVAGFELPGRAEVAALARRVVEDLRTLHLGAGGAGDAGGAGGAGDGGGRAAARRALGRMLLGPVAGRLGERRLAIVADGALQYVPFAALPDPAAARPGAADAPLLARHEIVTLPSASVLALLRRERASRPPAPLAVAVLADPVFDARDPRVRRRAAGPAAATVAVATSPRPAGGRSAVLRGGAVLQRLAASRQEAAGIAALVPAAQLFSALDFRTSRATVLAGDLSRYRILHFATHGVIDAETPALSGLVLSLVDEDGRPQEGFLGLDDIYNLELNAELVVLSGCETALGKEIRGEGLVGLTRGFLYAGAARVVASLWRVQDRATAELMARFYGALLRQGLRPAAALRQAQLAIARERRWRDPYYWAPFVLQGDWR
jgi:CHAT domain-containing protein/tetratricopeptide (TPR) repeat protein